MGVYGGGRGGVRVMGEEAAVLTSVSPVEVLREPIDRDAVGDRQIFLHNRLHVAAVKIRTSEKQW